MCHLKNTDCTKLQSIIQHHSELVITKEVSNLEVQRNNVYLREKNDIPAISRNRLRVINTPGNTYGKSFYTFLESLAKNKLTKVAVVFLCDLHCAAGSAAIRYVGGIIISQFRSRYQYGDYVLKPAAIPASLARWTENKWLPLPTQAEKLSVEILHHQRMLGHMGAAIKYHRGEAKRVGTKAMHSGRSGDFWTRLLVALV